MINIKAIFIKQFTSLIKGGSLAKEKARQSFFAYYCRHHQ